VRAGILKLANAIEEFGVKARFLHVQGLESGIVGENAGARGRITAIGVKKRYSQHDAQADEEVDLRAP
jgi:hypothetical protein